MSSNQPQDGGDSPKRGLIASVMSIPSSIFNQGADHGRQWRDRVENDKEGHNRWANCKRRRSQDEVPVNTPKPSEIEAVDADAWINQVAKEFEKREQFAKELYNSWNHTEQSTLSKNSNSPPTAPPFPASSMPDVERAFDHLWSWAKRPDSMTQSPQDTLFHQVFDLASSLENEIPQRLAFSGFGIPFMGNKLNPFLNDSIASGYSPLQLEQQEGFDNSWRIRFEDLVRVTNDQPTLSSEEAEKVKRQTWSRWLVDFQSRNVARGQPEKSFGCPMADKKRESSNDSQWPFDRSKMRDMAKDAWGKDKGEIKDTDVGSSKPWFQMSSVVETRNSHTNPDGSITTNINVVKRLPDGRVEKSERTETSPVPSNSIEEQYKSPPPQQGNESNRKGWFWSK